MNEKERPGDAVTSPDSNLIAWNNRAGRQVGISASAKKELPQVRRDVYEHLPAFYQAALRVLVRNGHVEVIE